MLLDADYEYNDRLMQLHLAVLRDWSAPDVAEYDLLRVPLIRYVVIVAYVIIIGLGTFGNAVVVAVIATCGRSIRPLPSRPSQVSLNTLTHSPKYEH